MRPFCATAVGGNSRVFLLGSALTLSCPNAFTHQARGCVAHWMDSVPTEVTYWERLRIAKMAFTGEDESRKSARHDIQPSNSLLANLDPTWASVQKRAQIPLSTSHEPAAEATKRVT